MATRWRAPNANYDRNSLELQPFKYQICYTVWLREQDLKLRPSGHEPNIFVGFLPTNRGGGQMVDSPDKPNSWQKLGGQIMYTY
jgi:hypothetical protein